MLETIVVGVSSQVPYSWTEFVDITVDMSVVVALFMPFNRYAPFNELNHLNCLNSLSGYKSGYLKKISRNSSTHLA